MIARRRFLAASGAAALVGSAARAQQGARPWRLAIVHPLQPTSTMVEGGTGGWTYFFAELRELGFAEGTNLVVERYSSLGRSEDFEALGRLVGLSRPDIIWVASQTTIARAAAAAAPQVPVIFTVGDALASGLVTNLARPGGNLTGITTSGVDLEGKRLELLREVLPAGTRVAYLVTREAWTALGHSRAALEAKSSLGLDVFPHFADEPFDGAAVARSITAIRADGAEAVHVASATLVGAQTAELGRATREAGLPACSPNAGFVDAGGLMSYSTVANSSYALGAQYVARVLRGERAGDLPVTQPDAFELALNLATARRLGLALPITLVARASRFIE